MFLYFSDWTSSIETLDEKGFSHGDKIIKVYACEQDPRELLNKPNLFVIKGNSEPFAENEIFHYPGRKSYTGPELEEELVNIGINEVAKKYFRAVFRFDTSPEVQSNQCMMGMKNLDGSWTYNHPFESIDGAYPAAKYHGYRDVALHTDIFDPESIARLRKIVDLDDPELVASYRDVPKVVRQEAAVQTKEGNFTTVERA